MKWPETLTLVRHDTSAFNELKPKKAADPLYVKFRKSYDADPVSEETTALALQVMDKFALGLGDHDTPLGTQDGLQAQTMSSRLSARIPPPDVIFVSPYERARRTLEKMIEGWPDLRNVKTIEEERIREQDHGLATLYNDWRVFNALNPDQAGLRKIQGPYWYRYPQGENVPDVRERLRSWLSALTRDFGEQGVLAVTHHLAILALRANLERWSAEQFLYFDSEQKPINAGVTIYKGNPDKGRDGHLELEVYNAKLY